MTTTHDVFNQPRPLVDVNLYASHRALRDALAFHLPGRANRISAQAHLGKFYGEFGFMLVGEPYLEDNIPHQEMLRQP